MRSSANRTAAHPSHIHEKKNKRKNWQLSNQTGFIKQIVHFFWSQLVFSVSHSSSSKCRKLSQFSIRSYESSGSAAGSESADWAAVRPSSLIPLLTTGKLLNVSETQFTPLWRSHGTSLRIKSYMRILYLKSPKTLMINERLLPQLAHFITLLYYKESKGSLTLGQIWISNNINNKFSVSATIQVRWGLLHECWPF